MPRLPDINAFGQRPVPVNRQGVAQQDTSAPGESMARLGQVLQQTADRLAEKTDTDNVFDGRRQVEAWTQTHVNGPKGALAKQGQAAVDAPNAVIEGYDAFVSGVKSKMTTNRQRAAFDQIALSRRVEIQQTLVRHAAGEKEKFERAQLNADLATSVERTVSLGTAGNSSAARAEIDSAGLRLQQHLAARGAPAEQISQALLEHSSRAHVATIDALVSRNQAGAARDYLAANAGAMRQEDQTRASAMLREGAARAAAQTFGDEVDKQGLDLNQALALARQRYSGDEETAAIAEVKVRFAERQTIAAAQQRDAANDAWKVIAAGGSRRQIKASTWNTLAGEEQRQIIDYEVARAQRAKLDAENREPDPSVYYGLRLMAAEDPVAFSKIDLMKSAPLLSKAHEARLIELQAGISKSDAKAMESQRTVAMTLKLLKSEIAAAGIDVTPRDGEPRKVAEQRAMFFGAISEALEDATKTKGSPLSEAEARRIGLNMLREGIEQGTGFSKDTWYTPWNWVPNKKRGYQIAKDPSIKASASFIVSPFDDIPQERRDALVKALYPNGAPRTPYGGLALTDADKRKIEAAYTRAVNAGYYK